jgi:type II secretory pathway pseudopilin PulG
MSVQQYRGHRERRGTALVASLIVVMVVAVMGVGLIQVQASMTRRQLQSIDRTRALYQAEAALAEAFLSVAQGKSGAVGSPDEPAEFDGGVYWVDASEDDDGRVTLNATGLAGSGRFALTVVLQRSVNRVGQHGMFARNDVTVGAGSIVDGYTSAAGDYASQVDPNNPHGATGGGGLLASDGDVILAGGFSSLPSEISSIPEPGARATTVYGDVRPGPQGVAQLASGVTVTGSTTPAGGAAQLAPIETPEMPSALDLGLLSLSSTMFTDRSTPSVIGPGERFLTDVVIPAGGTQTLTGPLVLVIDELVVEDQGSLVFDATSGPIMIYVRERFDLQRGSSVDSVVQDATHVSVFFDDLPESPEVVPVALDATGSFYGMLYAPDNTLRISEDFRLFGSAAAKDLIIDPNTRVSFDRSLRSTGAGMQTLPQMISWRVSELPNEPLVKSRLDPFLTMNLLGITSKPSAESHRDTVFELKYVGTDGEPASFVGDESTFDWTLVRRVVSVVWTSAATGLPLGEAQPSMLFDDTNFLGI